MNSPPVGFSRERSDMPSSAGSCAATAPSVPVGESECRTGLTKSEAEIWLDWLEAHGDQGWELTYGTDRGFTVRKHKAHS